MNSKMTTNSQLSTSEPKRKRKRKRKTKETTRTGTESEKWRLHVGFSMRRWKGRMGEKVQGIRSILGRHKIDGERSRMV